MNKSRFVTTIVNLDNAAELDCFVSKNPNGHFLQTSFWGRVKNDWKWFGVICKRNGEITGTAAVLVRRISKTGYHMMYCPRGPVCSSKDAETFAALVSAIKSEGEKYNAYRLKIDKDVPADNGIYREILLNEGFLFKKRTLGFEDFQCRFVFRLSVENKTEDEIFSSFSSKHRYNIRLAARKGVSIKICGCEKVDEFSHIMKITGKRDGFLAPERDYYERILRNFGENARLFLAYYGSEPIAGALAVRYSDKIWYFYGGSIDSRRNLMPNYLLQWEMIKWAIESGCKIYDFRGVSGDVDKNSPLYGIYRFKKGFGGDFTEFIGEADLIIKPFADRVITVSQKIIKKFK